MATTQPPSRLLKPAPLPPKPAAAPLTDVEPEQPLPTKLAATPIMRDLSVSSTSSRDNLRQGLRQRRNTLTKTEVEFLERLCMEGDEIEVNLAHERLQDDSLFFEPEAAASSNYAQDDSERGWTDDQGIKVGGECSFSSLMGQPDHKPPNVRGSLRARSGSDAAMMMGSEKRLEQLENRRKSIMLGRIWNTHANGIAVSEKSSRRSMLVRQQSLSSSSGRSSLDLYARPETEAIFRAASSRTLMQDNRTDNNRNQRRRSSVPFLQPIPNGHRASPRNSLKATVAPRRPSFRRMQSDGSRKSVSFKEMPEQARPERISTSDGGVVMPPRPLPLQFRRSDSISSVPSIHHATPIRSPVSSSASFASIHKAHHVHASDAKSDVTNWSDESDNASLQALETSFEEEKKSDPAWSAPVPTLEIVPKRHDDDDDAQVDPEDDDQRIKAATKLLSHDKEVLGRPVLIRKASLNSYNGEGMEVADFSAAVTTTHSPFVVKDSIAEARRLESLASFNNGDNESWNPSSIRTPFSFDETMSFDRLTSIFRRKIERSLSDENLTGIFLGGSRLLMMRETSSLQDVHTKSEDDSWALGDEDDPSLNYYDPWKVIEDEYENGYGGGGTLPFLILGTSADDVDSHPHVLSPPLMESLQGFMPYSISGENYWMKFSLVRDGASMYSFLQYARGAKYAVLALETVDGEVFGCFTTEHWRKNWNWFGGGESFLWRMRGSRQEKHHSIIDQAHAESEIDVFNYTGKNSCIQLCTQDRIAVGGGSGEFITDGDNNDQPPMVIKDHEWGFGLALESDMLHGSSSPSQTFSSPSLSKIHSDGSRFEIMNLELWTFTPCARLEDAEKLELGMLFLQQHQ